MNKNEFIAAVAEQAAMTKSDAAKAIDSFINVITKQLKRGDEVRLVGFGTFKVLKRAASKGRNPRTGESIQIQSSKMPKFRAGKELKEEINNSPTKRG